MQSQAETIVLDEDQARVVGHGSGPLLALGGPGTGKTTVLEERYIARATEAHRGEGLCTSDRIMFLVPNRAQKMLLQDRLTRRLLFTEGIEALIEVPVYTWHGLAYHLVSRHYDRLAYSEPPVLLTSPEQWGAVREALADENPAKWSHHAHLLRNRGFVDEVVDFIIRCEQRLLEDPDLDAIVEARPQWADLVRFFKNHRKQMRDRSRVDYPTLLYDAADLIANHDDVRDQLQHRFTHVLVDDGQELSFVQQRLLRFITGFLDGGPADRSLVVCADPDSAIERFRGADPAWLEGFDKEFGIHEVVTLRTSYRLSAAAAASATAIVAVNNERAHRPRDFAGTTALEVRRYPNLASEVDAVARELRLAHLKDGVAYEDMAILVTSPRAMLPALERALEAVEVPYSVTAPDRSLEREGVVHAFVQLARLAFEEPNDERLVELLRGPLVRLEIHEVRDLERAARAAGSSLCELLDRDAGDERAAELLGLRDSLRLNRDAPAEQAFWAVWEKSSHYRRLVTESRADMASPAHRDLDALVAFSHSLGRFVERRRGKGTLIEYLRAITRADFGADPWLPPERTRSDAVSVLSFHAAKGHQWDIVAVVGVVDGAIPKGHRAQGLFDPHFLDDTSAVERVKSNEAEDRRVFYVALTRARRRCLVTTSPGPTRRGVPSRYIPELLGEMPEMERAAAAPPLTFSEAAGRARQVLTDAEAPSAERLAALATIARIAELDPDCGAAQPAQWWWRWDWTEGAVAINEQSYREEGMPPDKLRTSYSRLSHFENCGLQYLANIVLGLDPEVTHHLHFGRWMHEIFEDCEKEPTAEQKQTGRRHLGSEEAVFTRYAELFDVSVFPNAAIARQVKADGIVMLKNYIRYMKPGSATKTEHGFKLDLDGHRIKGFIDRIDTKGPNVIVSDFKTSRNPIRIDEARTSLQLAIYYKATKEDPDLVALGEPISMQLLYPFRRGQGGVAKRAQNPDDAEQVLTTLPKLIDGILAEEFAPNPEADCQWCRFKPICPMWPEGQELEP